MKTCVQITTCRRKRFATIAADADRQPLAKFWALPPAEREAVTPEVREVQWMPLRDAVKHALSSMSKGVFVNDFQREAFEKYGRKRRDPMFITAAILVSVYGSKENVKSTYFDVSLRVRDPLQRQTSRGQ